MIEIFRQQPLLVPALNQERRLSPAINVLQSFIEDKTIFPYEAEILCLSFEEGLTPAQIANKLNVPRKTVRNIKRHGINKLPPEIIGQLRQLP